MPTLLRMPELAANTPEALLSAWLVEENVRFSAATAIATVETAKAAVDIEAEVDGIIAKFLVEPGADVEVGAPIALLAGVDEDVDIAGALAALGVNGGVAKAPPTPAGQPPEMTSVVVEVQPQEMTSLTAAAPTPTANGRIFASPLARRMAREAELSLDDIVGTGPGGRIVRADVAEAIGKRPAKAPEPVSAPIPAPSREAVDYVDIPHSRMRRAIAAGLTESKRTAPHFYVSGVANVDKLLKLRARINADSATRVSVNDLIVLAVAKAHVLVPRMNVTWTDDAVRQFRSVDIAVAVSTPDGLVTPVVRGVDRMSITTLAATTKDFADRARAGGLKPHELTGGTVSVSNLGMFGTVEFTAIINPPQASILAVGAATEVPALVKGKIRAVRQLRVNLSVDHRPVDGAVAAEWMRAFTGLLEQPMRIVV